MTPGYQFNIRSKGQTSRSRDHKVQKHISVSWRRSSREFVGVSLFALYRVPAVQFELCCRLLNFDQKISRSVCKKNPTGSRLHGLSLDWVSLLLSRSSHHHHHHHHHSHHRHHLYLFRLIRMQLESTKFKPPPTTFFIRRPILSVNDVNWPSFGKGENKSQLIDIDSQPHQTMFQYTDTTL